VELQDVIGQFGMEEFGQPLLYPDSEEWQIIVDLRSGGKRPSSLITRAFPL
jgi:hypothetical protein